MLPLGVEHYVHVLMSLKNLTIKKNVSITWTIWSTSSKIHYFSFRWSWYSSKRTDIDNHRESPPQNGQLWNYYLKRLNPTGKYVFQSRVLCQIGMHDSADVELTKIKVDAYIHKGD